MPSYPFGSSPRSRSSLTRSRRCTRSPCTSHYPSPGPTHTTRPWSTILYSSRPRGPPPPSPPWTTRSAARLRGASGISRSPLRMCGGRGRTARWCSRAGAPHWSTIWFGYGRRAHWRCGTLSGGVMRRLCRRLTIYAVLLWSQHMAVEGAI